MRVRAISLLVLVSPLTTAPLGAGEIKKVDLAGVTDEEVVVRAPVYDGTGLAPITIGTLRAGYNRAEIFRLLSKGLFTRGVAAEVSPSIDLGQMLSKATHEAAGRMGLPTASEPTAAGWRVEGSLRQILLESKQMTGMGALMFFGFVDLELTATRGTESHAVAMRCHHLVQNYGGGFTRKDEAAEALAALLVLSGQEIVARLNREIWRAPVHPQVEALIASLSARGARDRANDLLRIGFSGAPAAVPPLLALLATEKDEDDRVHLLDALANLGAAEAVPTLTARYGQEDEDCRFYTLKALDAIGGEAARSFIATQGKNDRDAACRNLALRVSG